MFVRELKPVAKFDPEEGYRIWSFSERVADSILSPPLAHPDGKITRVETAAATNLTLSSTPQTIAGSIASGEAAEFRFFYTDAAFNETVTLSLHSDHGGGSSAFPAIIEITDDHSIGNIVNGISAGNPRQIATSYDPPENSRFYFPNAIPLSQGIVRENGTVVFAFNPNDYGLSTGWYRARIRGVPKIHPWLGIPIGQGGDFTLAYWKPPLDLRSRIRLHRSTVFDGETITVEAESYGVDLPSTYDWAWGDLTAHGTLTPDTHVYSSPGNYEIILTVSDSGTDFIHRHAITVLDSSGRPPETFHTRRPFGLAISP